MAVTGPILSSALANDGVQLSFRIIIVIVLQKTQFWLFHVHAVI